MTEDRRPHSRACGWRDHEHGPACSTNCPTCAGKPVAAVVDDAAMRPHLDVHQVPRGSVVVLTGAHLETPDVAGRLVEEITAVTGHADFALLVLGAGAVEVWGPDDDLAAKVAALLPRDVPWSRHATPQVTAPDDVHPGEIGGAPVTTSSEELRRRATEGGIPTTRTMAEGEHL